MITEDQTAVIDFLGWQGRPVGALPRAHDREREVEHALPRLEALLTDDKYVVRYSAAGAILALS